MPNVIKLSRTRLKCNGKLCYIIFFRSFLISYFSIFSIAAIIDLILPFVQVNQIKTSRRERICRFSYLISHHDGSLMCNTIEINWDKHQTLFIEIHFRKWIIFAQKNRNELYWTSQWLDFSLSSLVICLVTSRLYEFPDHAILLMEKCLPRCEAFLKQQLVKNILLRKYGKQLSE